MKLSTHIVLGTGSLVLLATAVASYVSYRAFERAILPSQISRMQDDAKLMAERVINRITTATADVAVIARGMNIADIIPADSAGDEARAAEIRQRLARHFEARLLAKPYYDQIRFIAAGEGGREAIRVDRDGVGGAIRIVPERALQDKADRPYFQQALNLPAGQVYLSPIELNQEQGQIELPPRPVIRAAMPIHGADGQAIGVVVINLGLRGAFERLRATPEPGVRAYVVNQAGDYLVHPDRGREFGHELGKPFTLGQEFPSLARLWAEQRPEQGAADTVAAVIDSPSGEGFAAAVANVSLGQGVSFAVILLAPRALIMAPARSLLQSAVIGGLAAALVAVLLSLALSRRVAKPLVALTREIDRAGHGEPVSLRPRGPEEVARLTETFARYVERERLFSAVVQNSNDAIFTASNGGVITAWNRAAEELYGYSADEAIGMPVRNLVPDDLRDEYERIRAQFMDGEKLESHETVRLTKDGQRRLISISVSPIRSVDGAVIGACGISRDISAQKEADAMFRAAVEASPAAMIMVDQHGKIVLANHETLKMFGYEDAELIGQDLEILIPQRFRAAHPELRRSFVAQPSKRIMGIGRDLHGLRRDGAEFPVEVGLNPVIGGEKPMILSVVVDITERRRAAERLQRRTEELERSNEELQKFAYVASHDLQEPLRMVSSFCQLLKERYRDRLDGEAVEFIDFAVDGAQRMRQLINDLLDYSRLQTDKAPFAKVDARVAVDRALENLSQAVKEASAVISIGKLPEVHAHLGQLAHLFQNLIGNALKFRDKERRLEIKISSYPKGKIWEFLIEDNGIGIDPEQSERIFGVFHRLQNREDYEGTGIGLAICRRIVERHEGKIWVESLPGEGARFHFTLRQAQAIHERIPDSRADTRIASKEEV